MFLDSYRDEWIVCRGPMTRECAMDAAKRTDLLVAWIPESGAGLSSQLMAAVIPKKPNRPVAVQELRGESGVMVSIKTNANSTDVFGERVGELRSGERKAQLWKETVNSEDSFTVYWKERGVTYSLSVVPQIALPPVPSPTRAQVATIFAEVEVTTAP